MRFDHISTEQGLSQDIVNNIVQDQRGFMWFGTEDGLNRYDGYSIRVYKHVPRDSSSISNNWITALCVDREGRLWVGTINGLALYDWPNDQFIRIPFQPPSVISSSTLWINCIAQDSTGIIWVTTQSGLHRYDERSGRFISQQAAGTRAEISRYLFTDRRGTVLVGTLNGLATVDPTNGTVSPLSIRGRVRWPVGGFVSAIGEDHNGNLWVGTGESGLFVLDSSRTRARHYRHDPRSRGSLSSNIIHSVCTDQHGDVWIGTFVAMDHFDPRTGTFSHIRPDPSDPASLSGERIYRVYNDRAGSLWVGTYRGGISHYDPLKQRFQWYRHKGEAPGAQNDATYSVLEDSHGTLWVGTPAGLERVDKSTGRFELTLATGGERGPVTALHERADGTLWLGTEAGQLLLVTRSGTLLRTFLRKIDYQGRVGQRAIRALYESPDGTLLIGTAESGLLRLDTRTWKLDTDRLGGTGASYGLGVWSIHEDRRGNLWFGGWGGTNSVVRYSPRTGEAREYRSDQSHAGSISSPSVRTMFEDSSGTLWFGTWGGGLNRYDPIADTFTAITESDGLSNNFVKAILADAKGRLWISTEHGLTRYDPRSSTFKRFTTADGLQSNRFLSGSYSSGKGGWMYFGGEHGFNSFHPDSVRDNDYVPPVVITSFRILDRPEPIPERSVGSPVVHLQYSQDYFSFEFVALNFTQPWNNQYAYIMVGFDRDWIRSGTRRYAAYTHLPGGTYTFRVRGTNNDGIWNDTGASVLVIIDPPFWMTWWFWTMVASAGLLAIYALYRYRVNRLLEIERLRTRIASDLHDELASNLTSIAMFGKIVQDTVREEHGLPDEHLRLLDRIIDLSHESVSSIRDIIWTIDPRTETLGSLLQRLYDSTIAECSARDIVLEFQRPPDDRLPSHNLEPELRHHLWLILKETLHNAITHSGCSAITLSTTYNAPELAVSVHDNGAGFDPAAPKTGKGLGTLRMRAKQLSGTLTIETEKDKGTFVEFRCPL